MLRLRFGQIQRLNGVVTIASLLLIVYFAYHSLAGNHGYFALLELHDRQGRLAVELSRMSAERERMERRVDLMAQDRIDPDLLEETARDTLGFADPDDLIIFYR